MTATTTPSTRPARTAPRPTPRPTPRLPERRPHLEVVPDGFRSPRAQRRRARLVVFGGIVLACAVVFGVVGGHVLLTQGQFRLARLQQQADEAQAQYVRLRLEVAQLESPERVVAAAQERLGMIPPSAVTYLTPTQPVSPAGRTAKTAPTTSSSVTGRAPHDTTQGWSSTKPALVSHR